MHQPVNSEHTSRTLAWSVTIKIPRNYTDTNNSALSLGKNALVAFSKYKNVTISLILIIIYYILKLINPN
jgi:hypothetical protein